MFLFFFLLSLQVGASTDDTSVIDELSKETTQVLDRDITLKTFDSCKAFEEVMEEYVKSYWKNNKGNWDYRVYSPMMEMSVMEDTVTTEAPTSSEKSANAV